MGKHEQTYDGEHGASAGMEALFGAWAGPAIGLMDLDAFFASVEQLDHPAWRGKPVIVGGLPEERGVVSTASYEARPFGVRSAMPSAQAKRLCPHAIWTRGHFDRYREMSARVMSIIADETPFIDQVSIDEAFFDVTPGRFAAESPIAIVERIARRVSELGITCSIGLGSNKTVAKIASERDKPRGLTVVPPGTEAAFLAPLPVRAMSGIGKAAEAALHKAGIRTLGALADASLERLKPIFGTNTALVRDRAAGREISPVRALDDVSFSVAAGEFVAIIGSSGSGKSTLLHMIGGVDRPTSGTVYLNGENVFERSDEQLAVFRRREVGLVYQFYNLIPVLDVVENITLPVLMDGREVNAARLKMLLGALKLTGREHALPNQLSGGQQQRVAIGRALMNAPAVVLADEPTGNLDSKNSTEIMKLLRASNRQLKQTLIVITHDEDIALMADRVIAIEDGRLVRDERRREVR